MKVLFTDLDGTLLDRDDYTYEEAAPALWELRRQGIPVVFCSSKTRAELEYWRKRLQNHHPFIAENGGAIFIPRGYFPFSIPHTREYFDYEVIELGSPHSELLDCLKTACEESNCQVLGFHHMTAAEISLHSGLPLEQAQLAKAREYDEPFLILDLERAPALLSAIESHGKQWTRGGRFYHILGQSHKGRAVRALANIYRKHGEPVVTIGLGDRFNDAALLNSVDVPIIVWSAIAPLVKTEVPNAKITDSAGPCGWNEAVLEVLQSGLCNHVSTPI
jgi:mannosyl-3-phosphoglycerate phosphatase